MVEPSPITPRRPTCRPGCTRDAPGPVGSPPPHCFSRVASKLALEWSPAQVAGWLKREFPDQDTRQVSHETIYRSLCIQARGVRRCLVRRCGSPLVHFHIHDDDQFHEQPLIGDTPFQTTRYLTSILTACLVVSSSLRASARACRL
jgi:hypothetical protein